MLHTQLNFRLFLHSLALSNFQLRNRSRIHFLITILIKTQGSPIRKNCATQKMWCHRKYQSAQHKTLHFHHNLMMSYQGPNYQCQWMSKQLSTASVSTHEASGNMWDSMERVCMYVRTSVLTLYEAKGSILLGCCFSDSVTDTNRS